MIAGVVPNAAQPEPGDQRQPHQERHPDRRAQPHRDRGPGRPAAHHHLHAARQDPPPHGRPAATATSSSPTPRATRLHDTDEQPRQRGGRRNVIEHVGGNARRDSRRQPRPAVGRRGDATPDEGDQTHRTPGDQEHKIGGDDTDTIEGDQTLTAEGESIYGDHRGRHQARSGDRGVSTKITLGEQPANVSWSVVTETNVQPTSIETTWGPPPSMHHRREDRVESAAGDVSSRIRSGRHRDQASAAWSTVTIGPSWESRPRMPSRATELEIAPERSEAEAPEDQVHAIEDALVGVRKETVGLENTKVGGRRHGIGSSRSASSTATLGIKGRGGHSSDGVQGATRDAPASADADLQAQLRLAARHRPSTTGGVSDCVVTASRSTSPSRASCTRSQISALRDRGDRGHGRRRGPAEAARGVAASTARATRGRRASAQSFVKVTGRRAGEGARRVRSRARGGTRGPERPRAVRRDPHPLRDRLRRPGLRRNPGGAPAVGGRHPPPLVEVRSPLVITPRDKPPVGGLRRLDPSWPQRIEAYGHLRREVAQDALSRRSPRTSTRSYFILALPDQWRERHFDGHRVLLDRQHAPGARAARGQAPRRSSPARSSRRRARNRWSTCA